MDSLSAVTPEDGLRTYMRTLAERLSTGALAGPEVAKLYGQLKAVEDGVKNMAMMAADQLKKYVLEEGVAVSEAGSLRAQFGAYEVEARPRNTGYDPAKVQLLLRRKGLDVTSGCDPDIKYKPNVEKLIGLVATDRLTPDELTSCKYDIEYNLQRPKQVVNE